MLQSWKSFANHCADSDKRFGSPCGTVKISNILGTFTGHSPTEASAVQLKLKPSSRRPQLRSTWKHRLQSPHGISKPTSLSEVLALSLRKAEELLWKVTASCDQDMLTWRWRCHGVCCSARISFEQRSSLQDYPRCFWGSECEKVFGYVLISLLTSRSLLANRRKSRTYAWRAFELIFSISNVFTSKSHPMNVSCTIGSEKQTCFQRPHHLLHNQSSVYATHCSGSWNSPMNYQFPILAEIFFGHARDSSTSKLFFNQGH